MIIIHFGFFPKDREFSWLLATPTTVCAISESQKTASTDSPTKLVWSVWRDHKHLRLKRTERTGSYLTAPLIPLRGTLVYFMFDRLEVSGCITRTSLLYNISPLKVILYTTLLISAYNTFIRDVLSTFAL